MIRLETYESIIIELEVSMNGCLIVLCVRAGRGSRCCGRCLGKLIHTSIHGRERIGKGTICWSLVERTRSRLWPYVGMCLNRKWLRCGIRGRWYSPRVRSRRYVVGRRHPATSRGIHMLGIRAKESQMTIHARGQIELTQGFGSFSWLCPDVETLVELDATGC